MFLFPKQSYLKIHLLFLRAEGLQVKYTILINNWSIYD